MHKLLKSKLLTSEDYWAIWLGAFFLLIGIVAFLIVGHQTIGEELSTNKNVLDKQSAEVPFNTVE